MKLFTITTTKIRK